MKILFLCTANSCRSILSEAVFNHLAPSEVRAYSAGSFPSGVVNPAALAALEARGIATAGLRSKPVDAHEHLAPHVVVTVCDRAAGEACPIYFGSALRGHWSLADPSQVTGAANVVEQAYDGTLRLIEARARAFLAARPWTLGPDALAGLLAMIGSETYPDAL